MLDSLSPRAVILLQWSIYSFVISHVHAYEAVSRWGQATAVVNEVVFVYGGKTDPFNQFSYTSAPNNNDILLLSLASPFPGSSPPWEITTAANQSSSEGPALAWSTLSALNNTLMLLFGGQTDGDSPTIGGGAELLNVYSRIQPNWTSQLDAPPPSRIRHSSATSSSGLVFVFGGVKPDDSGIAFSDHFYFDDNTLLFTSLSTLNAPPDVFGHASIILSDGRILVFGGYCPSQGLLLPLSTIWMFDTMDLTWTVATTASASLPSPRVAFAAALILDGKIIIHGGSDSIFETNFADGWLLDTTQNPMAWTPVDALSQLGGLRDHFAVPSADQVIFGFGYAENGPAPASLQIYNSTSGNFIAGYLPPPITATPTQTLPQPTPTQSDTLNSIPYSSTVGIHPTSTHNPQDPNKPLPSHSGDSNDGSTSHTTAIAVGTSFGIMSLFILGLGAAYYIRKRHKDNDDDFVAIGDDDDGRESPHFDGDIPTANIIDEEPPRHSRLLSTLGISGAFSAASRMRSVRSATSHRRDMLADEDTRSLREWYNSRRRDGLGNSSWSLLSILAGARRSRNASTTSHGTGGLPTPWREKSDPFSDGSAVGHDEEAGLLGATSAGILGSRPHSRREMSYASYASSRSAASYRDPFLDPYAESEKPDFSPTELYQEYAPASGDSEKGQLSVRYVPHLPTLRPVAPPLSQQLGHPLSPLSEHTSQSTLPHNISSSGSSNAHSSENIIFSPTTGGSVSRATSRTSLGLMPTPISSSSSPILGGHPDNMLSVPTQPMRRSDSWWSKFSRTSLLDRRSNVAMKAGYDIRDPTPAPKLTVIDEGSFRSAATPSQKSPPVSNGSPGDAEQDKQLRASATSETGTRPVYATAAHGKSMSSVRTADSEAIERMAGTMDVVHRESRHRWSASMSSQGGLSIDTRSLTSEVDEHQTLEGGVSEGQCVAEDTALVSSPIGDVMTPRASGPSRLPSPPPAQKALRFAPIASPPPAERNSAGGKVSDRIHAYEKRMSQEQPSSSPPTNSKHREERVKGRVRVDYGLVPRPSLFVANPDHGSSTRSSSS